MVQTIRSSSAVHSQVTDAQANCPQDAREPPEETAFVEGHVFRQPGAKIGARQPDLLVLGLLGSLQTLLSLERRILSTDSENATI
jgi:hypothetical protein